jgi:hypothetical protein
VNAYVDAVHPIFGQRASAAGGGAKQGSVAVVADFVASI